MQNAIKSDKKQNFTLHQEIVGETVKKVVFITWELNIILMFSSLPSISHSQTKKYEYLTTQVAVHREW